MTGIKCLTTIDRLKNEMADPTRNNEMIEQNTTGSQTYRDADTRRLALEIIATLVNIKKNAADQLLVPAGVSDDESSNLEIGHPLKHQIFQ